jgi:hypothetical protein
MKHTPEPWHVGTMSRTTLGRESTDHYIENDSGYIIASVSHLLSYRKQHRANAERIVACVNACAGLDPTAVPLMYEALCALRSGTIEGFRTYALTSHNAQLIDEALSKAEGR